VTIGELALDAATHRVTWRGHSLKVGPTEFKLLHYLMKHPERVHSRSQLLDKVWGDHVFIEERTVDVHVKRLREALGGAGTMIETVRGAGYRLAARSQAASGAAA
jgi:two-component system, OmpR family, phosphate regulon response regulator PhoB